MRMTALAFVAALAISATPLPAANASTPPSPRPWLESIIERATKLATREVNGAEAEKAWEAEIEATIDDVLHWDELTRRALGRHWEKRNADEQKEFSALLREMIEASYRSKLRRNAGSKVDRPTKIEIEWLAEKLRGDKATSTTKVKAGRDVAVIEFKLLHADTGWRIYDVSIDDVSTVRTYRSQFGKIIAKSGFEELMSRMRTKTEEIRAGRATFNKP